MRTRLYAMLLAVLVPLASFQVVTAQEKEPSFLERAGRKIANAFSGSRRSFHERMNPKVMEAFKKPLAEVERSTVRIFGEDGQRSMGVVVDANGMILTKYSELKGDLSCKLPDGESVKAEMVGVDRKYDLALIKVGRTDLIPVIWTSEKSAPEMGSWLVTPGNAAMPLSVGVVSTTTRNIAPEPGFLGVQLGELPSGGVLIEKLLEGGVAAKAGLQAQDLVRSIDGQEVNKIRDLQSIIMKRRPNTTIDLAITRQGDELVKSVLLGRRSDAAEMTQERRMQFQKELGGKISERRDSFPGVFQHDSVLAPKDCGGPLVNLDGEVVGINIARFSRIGSFAYPASDVLPIIEELKAGKGKEVLEQRKELMSTSEEVRKGIKSLTKVRDDAIKAHKASLKELSMLRVEIKMDSEDEEKLQEQLQAAIDHAAELKKAVSDAETQVRTARDQLKTIEVKLISLRN